METCENCIWLLKVNKHPWNKGEGKGSISETMGYACAVQLDEQSRDKIIFFDKINVGCELHTDNKNYKLKISYETRP
jgi:hypothetical protein